MNVDPKNVQPTKPNRDFHVPSDDKNRPETNAPVDPKSKSFQKIVDDQSQAKPKEKPRSVFEMQSSPDASRLTSSQRSFSTPSNTGQTQRRDTDTRTDKTESKSKDKEVPKEKERIKSKDGESEDKVEGNTDEQTGPVDLESKPKEGKMALPGAQKEIPEGKSALGARDKSELTSAEKGDSGPKVKEEKLSKTDGPTVPRADMIPGQQAPQNLSANRTEMNPSTPTSASNRAQIAATVEALVSQVTVIQSKGQIDTVIELKSPPMLAGATIKLTEYNSAKGEFNITFANLKPEAKQFLDQQLLKNSLSEALEKKDIVVHQIITTTQPDPALPSSETKPSDQQRQDREGGKGGNQQEEGGGGQGKGKQQEGQQQR